MKNIIVLFLLLSSFCATANAGPSYSFTHIFESGDGAMELADGAIGESQLFVEINELGNQVEFIFTNIGPEASSITDVYFDNGTLLGIAYITNTIGLVEFSQLASPPDLPGGNNLIPAFETTTGFSADSDPPVQPLGVNPGEFLGIIFDLQGGGIFNDILNELESGDLRIGIHVQGFSSGGSESFINKPYPVPVPGTFVLSGVGIVFISWFHRSRYL